jgi:hypothetical protein
MFLIVLLPHSFSIHKIHILGYLCCKERVYVHSNAHAVEV